MYGSQWGSLAAVCSLLKAGVFFGRQVTQKIRIRYYKSHAGCVRACNEIEGLHDKIIITIVRSVYPKGYEIRTMRKHLPCRFMGNMGKYTRI